MTGPSAKAEQADRARVLANDRGLRPGDREPTTFHQMANLDPSLGGRFAKADYVVGQEPVARYPAGSGWTRNDVGQEMPLGVSVNDMQPCGEAFEIDRSIAQLGGPSAPAAIPGNEAVVSSSPAAAETSPPIRHQVKRRRV